MNLSPSSRTCFAALAAASLAVSVGSAGSASAAGATSFSTSTSTKAVAVVSCSGSATVSSASALTKALSGAKPGATIVLAPGTYSGAFTAKVSGTPVAPITLCGPSTAVLKGKSTSSGYGLHLQHANYWTLSGFAVQRAQKGVVLDSSSHTTLDHLSVSNTGDEAIHLRANSSYDTVIGSVVSDTGNVHGKFGEGIYVGSAVTNWCTYTACLPDASDHNLVTANVISGTTAESIDIKEGTSAGVVSNNVLSGVGMGSAYATALVNVKGNGYLVSGNVGSTSPKDGMQVHQVVPGWGQNNSFVANRVAVNASGYGYYLQNGQGVVYCSNTATGARSGLSNVACTPGG